MAEEEGIDFDAENRGTLHFYKTKAECDAPTRVTELLAKGGLERRAVTPADIRAIEPALQGDVYGGYYAPSDPTDDTTSSPMVSRSPASASA